jgi:hypothetical protein
LLLVLASTVNLDVDIFRLLRVWKWDLLFNERRGLTATGHSLSTEE